MSVTMFLIYTMYSVYMSTTTTAAALATTTITTTTTTTTTSKLNIDDVAQDDPSSIWCVTNTSGF